MPILQPSTREREYNTYGEELRCKVVYEWLFLGKSHRQIDSDVLGLNPLESKGWQSMGILHFLGLKRNFQGVFKGVAVEEAMHRLHSDTQDFTRIIEVLSQMVFAADVDLAVIENREEVLIAVAKKDTSSARRSRISQKHHSNTRTRVYTYVYVRNPDIVAEALFRSNGVCEYCQLPAPFLRSSDTSPYLEVHHITRLCDGGPDVLLNVAALCPNCHRLAHHGDMDGTVKEKLALRIKMKESAG